jgi:apolipoprotein N-acyltransferase
VRWLVALLVLHGGVFLALASPQRPVPLIWAVAGVPLFLALELALRAHPAAGRRGRWGRWLRVLVCTYPAGVVFAAITGDWVSNTAFVYGGLSRPMALAVNWFGYGSLFGLEFFFFLGVPFALARGRPWLTLWLVPLWCTVFQLYVPRFLFFTYGQSMVTALPVVQFADVLGSGGLNLLWVPLQLVLAAWLMRLFAPGEVSLRALAGVSAVLAGLFAAAFGYGHWQMERWAAREAAGKPVELVGIQPNFSLRALASNPALSHSDREQSLRALLEDSRAALARARREPGVPTLVLWPESVYPRAYFAEERMRAGVEDWVRGEAVELILATQDLRFERDPDGIVVQRNFGASVHVGPAGVPLDTYHKIALIPFGETIPFGRWLPFYRRWLKAWIPRISEFDPGRAHTVFELANGVRVAPMICFDAADESVARGMARNGARLGVVLANLAWFGATTVSDQFGWFARFRAIENRMPILFLSQNGESFLLDSRGRETAPRLPQFRQASLVERVQVPVEGSFYAAHGEVVNRAYLMALVVVVLAGWREPLLRRLRRLLRSTG